MHISNILFLSSEKHRNEVRRGKPKKKTLNKRRNWTLIKSSLPQYYAQYLSMPFYFVDHPCFHLLLLSFSLLSLWGIYQLYSGMIVYVFSFLLISFTVLSYHCFTVQFSFIRFVWLNAFNIQQHPWSFLVLAPGCLK